jgi:XTP/dITP diphosphohydrolase
VVSVVDRLRSPGGCPWDAAQTHASLAKYLLEEAYEAYAAIEEDDLVALREEMGDVLVQVALHARLAEEHLPEQRWSIDDVAGDLVAKLVRRHPHVFATATAATPEAVEANWQRLKEAEKSRSSVTEGVPLEQPALALAAKLQERAAGIGAEVPGADPAILRESAAGEHPIDALGELLFHVVALARSQGVDAEAALRATSRRFRDRLAAIETTVRAAGRDPRTLSAAEWESHWANSAAGPATSHSSPPN